MTRAITTILTFGILTLGAASVFAAPYASLIFEYTVGPDGTRRGIHIVKIEEPVTNRDLSGALTQKERQRGIAKVSTRPPLSRKEAGKKLYEVAIFDLGTHRYVTD